MDDAARASHLKNAKWIDHIFGLHVLDHEIRTPGTRQRRQLTIDNEFIGVSFEQKIAALAHVSAASVHEKPHIKKEQGPSPAPKIVSTLFPRKIRFVFD